MKALACIAAIILSGSALADSGFRHVYPSSTHADGKNGSQWRTSLSITNPNDVPVKIEIDNFLASGTALQKSTLAPNETVYHDDVIADMGLPDGTYAIQVTVLGPDQTFTYAGRVAIIAKTYNLLADGSRLWTLLPEKAWNAVSFVVPFDRSPGVRNRLYVLVYGTNFRIRLFGPDGLFLDEHLQTGGLLSFPIPEWATSAIVEAETTPGPSGAYYDLYAYGTSTDNRTGDSTVIQ